jgi:hypothetical protein
MLNPKHGAALWFVVILLVQGALQSAAASGGGVGYYSSPINWSFTAPLYYSVAGAPPNVCGESHTFRNGVWRVTASWICTDASGNATKGPWTWAGTPADQTDNPTYILWPDGTSTTSSKHVWDKTCAQVFRDSPSGTPPTAYYGHAADGWGAGFDASWTSAFSTFQDLTTGLLWNPSSGGYSTSTFPNVPASVAGWPASNVNWSSPFPPPGVHLSGHTYRWQTCVTDGACGCTAPLTFTVP